MSSHIRTAVFPVAGRGSRLLPLTHGIAKALLPVGPRSLLHHAMREAALAGVERFVVVVDRESILSSYVLDQSYLDPIQSSEGTFGEVAAEWRDLLGRVVALVPQRVNWPRGFAAAIASVEEVVSDDIFAIVSTDEIVFDPTQGLAAVAATQASHGAWAIGLTPIDERQFDEFGVVQGEQQFNGTYRVLCAQEKPGSRTGHRGYGIAGRYVVDRDVFDRIRDSQDAVLREQSPAGFHFVGAIDLAARAGRVNGVLLDGGYLHAGHISGYIAAWRQYLAIDPPLPD